MDIENSKAQLKKGILEFCILSIISRGEAYTSDILEEMKAAKLLVVEGTMYPLLSRLKNEGLLSYNWVESKSGPPRKYYQLTEDGKKFMNELELTWIDLVESVERLTNKTKDLENK
ncbi:MAG: PadR family transcriptional regulator [Bacteroidia bacterium]